MPLLDQANLIRTQMGYAEGLPLVQIVEKAEVDLGLSEQARGLPNMVERVSLVLSTIGLGSGAPFATATATVAMGTVVAGSPVPGVVAGAPMVVAGSPVPPVAPYGQPVPLVAPQGELYRLEPGHMTWAQHDQAARRNGCTLAPVTSAEEAEVVMRAARGQTVWIGAVRHGRGNGPGADHWHWSNGEPWTYSRWCRGEPNNYAGQENRVQMYGRREFRPPWGMHANDGEWNDINGAWTGPAVYKVGSGTWTPAPQAMLRDGALEPGLISARELQGCWVGCALLMPWSGSLRAVDEDTYVRDWQLCLLLPLCGREYRRTSGTNTFHWHEHGVHKGNEDYENFRNTRCACMAPGEPPGGLAVGVRLC